MKRRAFLVFLLPLLAAGCFDAGSDKGMDDDTFQADVPDAAATFEDTVNRMDQGFDARQDPGPVDTGSGEDTCPCDDGPPDGAQDLPGNQDTPEGPDTGPADQGSGSDTGGCTSDSDCDNGNPCTTARCFDGQCRREWNQEPCDDGDPCTTDDRCMSGKCVGGPPPDCDDGNSCTRNSCKAGIGCSSRDIVCNDNNPCTDDSCDPEIGCLFVPNDGPCDDGDLCTVNDHCVDGTCVGGGDLDCADLNPCTDDWCQKGVGCVRETRPECPTDCVDASDCDDGNPATADICNPWNSQCEHILLPSGITRCTVATAGVQCSDGDPCTADLCLTGFGCVNIPVADCDRLCNHESQCHDGDPCTADICTSQGYCAFVPLQHCGAPCREATDCLDGNQCTLDICVYDFAGLITSTCLNLPIPNCTP